MPGGPCALHNLHNLLLRHWFSYSAVLVYSRRTCLPKLILLHFLLDYVTTLKNNGVQIFPTLGDLLLLCP